MNGRHYLSNRLANLRKNSKTYQCITVSSFSLAKSYYIIKHAILSILTCIILYYIILIISYCYRIGIVLVLYYIILYYIILYYIILYYIVLYCIVLYCIVLYCIVSYRIVSYRIVSYRIVSYRIVLYCIIL